MTSRRTLRPTEPADRSAPAAPGAAAGAGAAPLDDAALVAALRARSPWAFAALFDRYAVHVRRILLHLLGAQPDIPDLIHDVFIVAIEDIGLLARPEALRGWVSGIAVHTARAFIRRRMRWWHWPSKRPWAVTSAPTAAPDVSAALKAAYEVLDRLPADERIVFVLRLVEELPFEEIASLCRTSIPTARRRLRRAEARFRKLAKGEPLLQSWGAL